MPLKKKGGLSCHLPVYPQTSLSHRTLHLPPLLTTPFLSSAVSWLPLLTPDLFRQLLTSANLLLLPSFFSAF